jgi:hypothetical protein
VCVKVKVQAATKLPHLKLYRLRVVQKLSDADRVARLSFRILFCRRVCRTVVYNLPTYFTDEARFCLNVRRTTLGITYDDQ